MLAAMKGHAAVCRSLLEKKAEVNAVNEDGETPLMMAAAMGHTDVVSLLLQSGGLSSVDAKDKNEMSAIKKAARWGHVDCLRLLTNGKFDDREMKHCLLFGKLYGHPEVRMRVDASVSKCEVSLRTQNSETVGNRRKPSERASEQSGHLTRASGGGRDSEGPRACGGGARRSLKEPAKNVACLTASEAAFHRLTKGD